MAQNTQKFQPLKIRGEADAQAPAGISRNLPDQQTRWKNATITRADNPVAGTHQVHVGQAARQAHRAGPARGLHPVSVR